MQKSESIAALAAALAKAQGSMRHALKDSVNPHFKSRYADLASVLDAVRSPLADYGLAVVQLVGDDEHGAAVETVLMHASGEWISSRVVLPVSKADAQGYGSAITYARRYALAAICGVAQDDDDGDAARKAPPPAKPASEPMRTREQAEAIEAALQVLGVPEAEWGAKVRKLAGRSDSKTEAGAQVVLDALGRELDTRTKAETGK
jgi:ERF superfamily